MTRFLFTFTSVNTVKCACEVFSKYENPQEVVLKEIILMTIYIVLFLQKHSSDPLRIPNRKR